MSHVVQISTQVRDAAAVQSACQRLQLPPAEYGTFRLFSDHATGLGVRLPEWKYPVVCELATGAIRFDNYQGRWGHQQHVDRFLQIYAVEKSRLEARKQGHRSTEQTLPDGSIKVTIHVGENS